MSVLFSVIVPVYNTKEYLSRCLDSIINQTYRDLEIICVDDGSTDGSGELLDRYAKTDNRIIVIHKENGGSTSARRIGAEICRGSYVSCIDSDDWIEAGMYDHIVGLLKGKEYDLVTTSIIRDYGEHVIVDNEKIEPGYYAGEELERKVKDRLVDYEHPFRFALLPSLCNKVIKASLYKKWQLQVPEEITIDDDTVCVYPCIMDSESIYVSDMSYYHYCQRASSQMMSINTVAKDKIESAYKYLRTIMSKEICDYLEMYALLLSAPDEVIRSTDSGLYPFGELKKNSKIVIYGMGSFGRHLKKSIDMMPDYRVAACVDKNGDGKNIMKPSALSTIAFDYVLVGILLWEVRQNAIEDLWKLGIRDSKICQVQLQGDGCCD